MKNPCGILWILLFELNTEPPFILHFLLRFARFAFNFRMRQSKSFRKHYFSIESILVSEEPIPCSFLRDQDYIGKLKGSLACYLNHFYYFQKRRLLLNIKFHSLPSLTSQDILFINFTVCVLVFSRVSTCMTIANCYFISAKVLLFSFCRFS